MARRHAAACALGLLAILMVSCTEAAATEPAPATVIVASPALSPEPTPAATVAATPQSTEDEPAGGTPMELQLKSSAFEAGDSIPTHYSCDGADVSPPLTWDGVPAGTSSFALIFDDPDAPVGIWVHWVLFNLPPETRGLPEGVSAVAEREDGSRHGRNSWGRIGYGGPCPPGGTHRYFFKLYALDARLELPPEATKQAVLDAMAGHILAQAELMGTYTR